MWFSHSQTFLIAVEQPCLFNSPLKKKKKPLAVSNKQAMRSEVAEQKQELRAESGIGAIKALCDITNRLIYSTARFSTHVEERTKEAKGRLLSFLEFE